MAVISKTTRNLQAGAETTPGNGVAANRLLDSLSSSMEAMGDSNIFKPTGQKFATTVIPPSARTTKVSFDGPLTYTQVVYPLSSAMRVATITTPGDGVNSRTWTYDIAPGTTDTIKTFTLEEGDATRAQKCNYAFVDDLKIEFSKKEVKLSGSFMGREIQDQVTITSSPSSIAIIPVAGHQVQVFLADTQAGLAGASALSIGVSGSFSISNRQKPQHRLDATTTFANIVETPPDVTLALTLDADNTGYGAVLSKLTSGATQFVRIKATGANIEGAIPYLLQIDFAGAVKSYPKAGENEGALLATWEFQALKDPTWGKACEVQVQNALTAL